ncbi:hypothetical protein GO001_14230 [Streptomyces sp. NRRL B-1677]|uniref:hypothetical protein n=1 Tax=Streptomyces sp. NRRL B-1677 TaxID=2682966 RepID=UPI001892AB90|nr:hypothetical protein [Streptomyces sp. NRRL B-1677]MBF6046369.1 hypothetical protein [Streptomyces sp. NRRL B-1677]
MDAGLAAVLGATVGAIGTGGAGITAALLARHQARAQLRAEHARIIREPRRAAYASYAESAIKNHNQLLKALTNLNAASQRDPSEARSECIATARQCYETVKTSGDEREQRHGQVTVEGPLAVTEAAVSCESDFIDFKIQVMECLHQLEHGESCDHNSITSTVEKCDKAYTSYLTYLHAASRAINADGITRLPE